MLAGIAATSRTIFAQPDGSTACTESGGLLNARIRSSIHPAGPVYQETPCIPD